MDPKYRPRICHEDGYPLDDDEPIMIFRGKDVGALVAIMAYIRMLENEAESPNKTINDHIDSALERLEAFYNYQINNPKLQSVTCSNKNHKNANKYLNNAFNMMTEWGY